MVAIANPKTCSKSIAHLTSPQKTATHTHTHRNWLFFNARKTRRWWRSKTDWMCLLDGFWCLAGIFVLRTVHIGIFRWNTSFFFVSEYVYMCLCVYICGMKIAKDRKLKKNCSNVFLYIIQAHIFSVVVWWWCQPEPCAMDEHVLFLLSLFVVDSSPFCCWNVALKIALHLNAPSICFNTGATGFALHLFVCIIIIVIIIKYHYVEVLQYIYSRSHAIFQHIIILWMKERAHTQKKQKFHKEGNCETITRTEQNKKKNYSSKLHR